MKYFPALLVFLAVLLFSVVALSSQLSSPLLQSGGKPTVVASFYPLYFFASQITGDRLRVLNLTPAGIEPHDWEPSPQDISALESSTLILVNGGTLETWTTKLDSALQAKTVIVGQGLFNGADPHIWLSPRLAQKVVERITKKMMEIDPKGSMVFQSRGAFLGQKLAALDKEYQNGLKNCRTRAFVTSHLAFSYLATDYNLNQVAVSGISPDEEPSLEQMAKLTDFVKQNQIKYIFTESFLSPKLSETLAAETRAMTLVLNPLEGLTETQMKVNADYFTIMEENLKNLRVALQCR